MGRYIVITTLCDKKEIYETAEISSYDILNADDKFFLWIDENTK